VEPLTNGPSREKTVPGSLIRSALASEAARPTPLVTVITPAFNVEPYIGEAVDSVLRQRFSDFEYLVVDDGSTDQTVNEVRKRTDPRLKIIMAPHGGPASARNVGLDRANGQFIAFLDGDDRWHPNFLRRQIALLQSAGQDVAAVFARSRVISQTGRVYAFRWQRAGYYDFDDMLIYSCPPRTGSSLLIRKSAFDVAGYFYDKHTVGDLDMWLRIQRDSGMPYFIGGTRYIVDLRVRSGATGRNHQQRFEKLDCLIREHSAGLRRHPSGMAYVRAAVFAFRAGEEAVARRWAQLAWTAGFWQLARDSYGWRLIGWTVLQAPGRVVLRRCDAVVRGLVGLVISAPGGLLR
jgi:glycosyltransferase involved in cell wall biosynthesis